MVKIIAHIDLNAFFCRCEEIKDPSLINKAVAVGSDGRGGIVSTCSYKAREYGVKSGMPMFKAKELCKNLIIKNVDFMFYELMSLEFINFIKLYTKKVKQASIDECYADFTEELKNYNNPILYFLNIQKELYKKLGLKCSIGVSTTKFLAKMGSDFKKPLGLTIIRKKDIKELLFPLTIDKFYGIGVKSVPKLNSCGVFLIGDFYYKLKNNDDSIGQFYIKHKDEYLNAIEGKSSDFISLIDERDPKSISCRETLFTNLDDSSLIYDRLLGCFNKVYDQFMKTNKVSEGITISLRYVNLQTKTFSKKLEHPTNDKLILLEVLEKLFFECYKNEPIRQIGVILDRLTSKEGKTIQMSLFNYNYYEEKDVTSTIIDTLNKEISNNNNKLFRASRLLKQNEN